MNTGKLFLDMEPSGLSLRLFGPFKATFQGKPLPTPRTRKAIGLLALLALRAGCEVERAYLAGTLWPESDEHTGQTNLRQTLSILRTALGPASDRLVAVNRRVLCLHLSENDQCDVVAFDRLVTRWERTYDTSLAEQTAILGETGPFLEDSREDWAAAQRMQRETQMISLWNHLSETALDRQDYAPARIWAEKAAGRDPLHEPSQRLLYRALAGSGDLTAARRAYRDFRVNLYREAHLNPDAETVALMERLTTETESKIIPAPVPTSPAFLTPFLGREREQEEILRYLATPGIRLVTLLGIGGIGKTRLAVAVAGRTNQPFPFVDLAAFTTHAGITEIYEAIAAALSLFPSQQSRSARDRILEAAPAFLLLDNCEHLESPCRSVVGDLLRFCPNLRILATSRHTLGVPGEVRWPVPPLTEAEAMQLFHQRAATVRPNAGIEDQDQVRELCRRLDALPLALELAAARRNILSIAQIIERLDHRFRLLADTNASPDARQGTLQNTLAWSWDLLTPKEQDCLRCLSVFSGGWTLEAVQAVAFPAEADEIVAIEILSRLANRSLISIHAKEGRGMMLETIRQYAHEQTPADELSSIQARHVQYFLTLARDDDDLLHVGSERDNLRAALEYADPDTALSLCVALGEFYLVRGHAEEGIRRYQEFLVSASITHPERPTALYQAGRLFQARGDMLSARRCLEEGLSEIEPGEIKLRIRLLGNLGLCAREEKDFEEARQLFVQALELADSIKDAMAVASLNIRLGILAFDREDLAEAARRFDSVIHIASQNTKTAIECAVARTLRGDVSRNQNQYQEAIGFYTQALVTHTAYGYRAEMARTLLGLGQSQIHLNQTEPAREHLLRSRELFEELKDNERVQRVAALLEGLP